MAKVEEMTERERQAADLLRDLEALPPGHQLRGEELMSFIRRLPKLDLPENWTSADDIRDFRGPLPAMRRRWLARIVDDTFRRPRRPDRVHRLTPSAI